MKRSTETVFTVIDAEMTALDAEYRQHAPWLRALAARKLGTFDDAEDLVQEAYLRVARYPARARVAPRSLLARILSNLIKDRSRARSREGAAHGALALVTARDATADQQQQVEFKRLILGMPTPMRDVFLLVRFTQLTQAQIAERLGVSVKTVEARLAKALSYCAAELCE